LAMSRARDDLIRHDLLDAAATRGLLEQERPDVLVHAAAERRPDLCEGQPDHTKALNVTASSTLCQAVRKIGGWTLFISTDYVFDGMNPPYLPGDETRPLNAYGESKLAGEEAVFSADADSAALRVPILYGEVEELGESAVTVILNALLDLKPAKMDHWAVRRPTLVDDVATACLMMARRRVAGRACSGIWHFGGDEPLTKYDMAMAIAEIVGLDGTHLTPDDQHPAGAPRPRDCSFDCSAFDSLFHVDRSLFRDKIGELLRPFLR